MGGSEAPRTPLPAQACDTHAHICGPQSRYAYVAGRIYTPPDALLADYHHVAATLGIHRVVFVQPSVYGTDNTAMLNAMGQCALESRGIAVIDPGISDVALRELDRAGIRGIRLNLVDVAAPKLTLPLTLMEELAKRVAPLGWHLEMLLHVDDFPNLDASLKRLPVDIVVGHLGYLRQGRTVSDPGFQALLRLMQRGRCWVKLTGPYRLSSEPLPYRSVAPLARSLAREAPERLLWGSDWPHVMVKGAMPNDGDLVDLFLDWVPESNLRQKILVDNPGRLYGF